MKANSWAVSESQGAQGCPCAKQDLDSSWTPATTFSGHAEQHERHIIVLGSACGKRLCGCQDSPHAFQSWKPMTRFGEFDQSLFAPFFVANVHGFGNSVRKEHYQVSGLVRKHASLIVLWEKTDHWTTGFQT